MANNYVELRDGVYRVGNTRVALDSIIYAYHRGASPESLQRSFPSLTLEQIHGALAFYLSHKQVVDEYLVQSEIEFEKLQSSAREEHADWYDRMRRAREEALVSRS